MPATNYDSVLPLQYGSDHTEASSRWKSPSFTWGIITGVVSAVAGMMVVAEVASIVFSLGLRLLWGSFVCYLLVVPLLAWLLGRVFFGRDFPLGFFIGYAGMTCIMFAWGIYAVFG